MNNNQQNIIIYKTADGKASVALYAKDGNIGINQNQLAELFATSKQNIGQHISNILEEGELEDSIVVKNYFTTADDGKQYNVTFYSLDMILAIGFRVRSKRVTQFRIWANKNLKEYMVKNYLTHDEIDTLNRLLVNFLESAELREEPNGYNNGFLAREC